MAQKTILQIAQLIASELSLVTPQVVVSSTDTNIIKIKALIIATCDDLLNELDWQFLQTRTTFTTTAGVDSYDFPTDINRFIGGSFFDQNNRWPMQGPLTAIEWEALKVSNLATSPFARYRVFQNKIFLYPTPSANYTFVYEYMSNGYVQNGNTGDRQAEFTQDSDICLFDHRTVVYGTKLKWLASMGLDTTAALVDYSRALDFCKGFDAPTRRINLAGRSAVVPLLSVNNIADTGFGDA